MKFKWQGLELSDFSIICGFALMFYPLACLMLLGDWLIAGVISGLFGWIARTTLRKYEASLLKRIESDNNLLWDVELNCVKVGTISDSEYAAVRLEVFRDVSTYGAQVINIGKVALRVFDYFFIAIPLGLFWVVVILAVFSPENFNSIVAEIQKHDTEAISHAARIGAQFFSAAAMLIIGFHWVFGLSRFGFINYFSANTARAVRMRCMVAAEGEITLVRYENGTDHINNEMFYVRAAQGKLSD